MEDKIEKLVKLGTLGGKVGIKKDMMHYYFGENKTNGPMSKEKLFGVRGPILFGMPHKQEMALESTVSDTQKDLVRELEEKGLTREEARMTISELIREGVLVEEYDPDLGQKVLVIRG